MNRKYIHVFSIHCKNYLKQKIICVNNASLCCIGNLFIHHRSQDVSILAKIRARLLALTYLKVKNKIHPCIFYSLQELSKAENYMR